VKRHPELDHDEEIWVLFTEQVICGMGGRGATYDAAVELERGWAKAHHFDLYDDVLPVLADLRGRGLRLGLLSNSARDLDEFVVHHRLDVDAVLTSYVHGKTKPHETIFRSLLAKLDVDAEESVMVGDAIDDDIEGALAVGMRALLLDRDDRYPDVPNRLGSLAELAAALDLP
jgi:HAD superfamily hydrolase (TIGR01549 family)